MTPAAARRLRLLARLAFGGVLFAIVLALVDLRGTLALLREARPGLVLAGLALLFADRAAMALKWRVLLRAKGIELGAARAFRLYLASTFISTVLPSSLGGDVWRGLAASRTPEDRPSALASVLVERALGLTGTLVVSTLAALAAVVLGFGRIAWVALGVGALGLLGLALGAMALRHLGPGLADGIARPGAGLPANRLLARAAEIGRAVLQYRDELPALGLFLVLTVLEQGLSISVPLLFARAVGSEVPALAFFVAVPLVSLLEALPISLGGLGVREGGYVALLSPLGMRSEAALAISILTHAGTMVICAPGAFTALVTEGGVRAVVPAAEERPA